MLPSSSSLRLVPLRTLRLASLVLFTVASVSVANHSIFPLFSSPLPALSARRCVWRLGPVPPTRHPPSLSVSLSLSLSLCLRPRGGCVVIDCACGMSAAVYFVCSLARSLLQLCGYDGGVPVIGGEAGSIGEAKEWGMRTRSLHIHQLRPLPSGIQHNLPTPHHSQHSCLGICHCEQSNEGGVRSDPTRGAPSSSASSSSPFSRY